jgi:hypothetical protein
MIHRPASSHPRPPGRGIPRARRALTTLSGSLPGLDCLSLAMPGHTRSPGNRQDECITRQ